MMFKSYLAKTLVASLPLLLAAVLTGCSVGTNASEHGDDYLSVMRANLAVLQTALQ